MCLIAFAYRQHARWPLILLANRDEFHDRPSQPLHRWKSPPILAGRDEVAGGTWLGIDERGRLAAVTNYREHPQRPAARSRGALPVAFLSGAADARTFAERLQATAQDHAGFNILLHDGRDCVFASNRHERPVVLQPGFHGISNGGLDDEWPKVVRTRDALREVLARDQGEDEERLLALLSDRQPAAADQLPKTGLDLGVERFLSPPFICDARYGTRASTLLWLSGDRARIVEHRYAPDGRAVGRSELQLP